MQEIIQQAKALNDQQLGELITKLTSILDKRELKAKRVAEEQRQQMEAQQRVIQQINELVANNGLSLEQLGFVATSEQQKEVAPARKKPIINPVNQTYVLVDGKPKLIFTRMASELLAKGEALKFEQLTEAQQQMAIAVTAEYNEAK